jgi:tetratricopeptide (TPR) repeat protein
VKLPNTIGCVAAVLVLAGTWVHAQEAGKLSLQLSPGANFPLGAPASMFRIGGGAELAGLYSMPFAPFLVARGALDFSIVPTTGMASMSLVTASAGVGVSMDVASRLNLQASVSGGWGQGIYQGQSGGSVFASGDASASFLLAPFLGLGVGASYRHYFSRPAPFYQAVRVSLGTVFRLGAGSRKPRLEIPEIRLDPLFPVFYKHYNDHRVGTVVIRNGERGSIRDVKVSFFVGQYMDRPKESEAIPELKQGEQREVDLFGLFTNQVLTITEGTQVNAVVRVSYRYADADMTRERSETLRMYDRNAMTWQDDRRAAAFVTAKDPEVLRFSKRVEGLVREQGSTAVNLTFRKAMGIFEALGLYGMVYAQDPKTPYAELSRSDVALDYLQFPAQTLGYKAGDCDDLSILYCALLESVAVETAFITSPGHIYAAFSLGATPDEARALFSNPGDLIYVGDQSWVPVEITMMQSGFLEAWARGAKEWREATAEGKAHLYPVHDAWASYEPVGLPDAGAAVIPPAESEVLSRYGRTLTRFVEREIAPRVTDLVERITASGDDPRQVNKLGLLYAQYGLLDKAVEQFERAAARQYAMAFANLGNCYLLQKKLDKALESFQQAERSRLDDVSVLVGLAKVRYEREEQAEVRALFDRIQRKDPAVAERFSYLVGGGAEAARASAAMMEEAVLWARED